MKTILQHFCKNESGAVTVDWVVLTAAIVGLGIAVVSNVSDGALSLTDQIVDQLEGSAPNSGN